MGSWESRGISWESCGTLGESRESRENLCETIVGIVGVSLESRKSGVGPLSPGSLVGVSRVAQTFRFSTPFVFVKPSYGLLKPPRCFLKRPTLFF